MMRPTLPSWVPAFAGMTLLVLCPTLLLAANPLNTWLSPTSTTDDHSAYLCGMDASAPPDGDTIAIEAKWKIIIWSAAADEAAKLKQYDSTVKLILYASSDHGLQSLNAPIDTTDPGNEWSGMTDECSHYRKVAADSSKSYYSMFYHFADTTKILLAPRSGGGFTFSDTMTFYPCTLPISDDDSSSVVPDIYMSPYFTASGTFDTLSVDTVGTVICRSFRYIGTPRWKQPVENPGDTLKVTRVNPDFSNPMTRYADRRYMLRALATNYANLGGTDNDVYGWRALSDAGFTNDGVYLDNFSDVQQSYPEGSQLLMGGTIRCSRGLLGSWYADSTLDSMNGHMKEYSGYLTDYLNDGANFADGIPRATSANFGTWKTWYSNRNPITQWYDAANKINLKLLEFSRLDGGYSSHAAHEAGTTNGLSMSQLEQMDSLAEANDFYILFAGVVDYIDTATASGWPEMKQAFQRSNWVRLHTVFGHRALYAPNPLIASATTNPTPPPATVVYMPCNGAGTSYRGLNYPPECDDRSEVRKYVDGTVLPFMWNYDLGQKVNDSSITVRGADAGNLQNVSVWKTFWRKVSGSDTTYSWMYYYPRPTGSTTLWGWRHIDNHYVNVDPPSTLFKRLEYDGSLSEIGGVIQRCYMGDQLILTYTTSTPPAAEGSKVMIRKPVSPCVGCEEELIPDPIP